MTRSKVWSITEEDIRLAYHKYNTINGLIEHFGLSESGYTYKLLKQLFRKYDLPTDKFVFSSISGDKQLKNPASEGFIENSTVGRGSIKSYIIRNGLIEYKCEKCGLVDSWQNEKLTLVLDHINGINNDNRLENLRFLCHNCHSQTATFAGRNKPNRNYDKICNCGKPKSKNSKHCIKCRYKEKQEYQPRPHTRKVARPSREELEKLIWEKPTTKIAIELGISDKAIEKWCKIYKIQKPGRGYWQKHSLSVE